MTVRLLTLLLIALCAACADAPERAPVGRLHRAWVDEARPAWSGDGARPLSTTVWYPAAAGSAESPWTAGVFVFGRSAADAPLRDGPRLPLILLSHGTGGSAAQLSWLAEALVGRGYLVAAVSHHGNTAAEPAYTPHGFVLPWERAHDLSALIDQLLADPALASRIDRSRIGAAGFSLGGYSVLASIGARLDYAGWRRHCASTPASPSCALPPEAPFTLQDVDALAAGDRLFQASIERAALPTRDPRIAAVYAIAPALVDVIETDSLAAIDRPLRLVVGEADSQVPAQAVAGLIGEQLPDAQIERLPGAGHYSFLAPCSLRGRLFLRALCADPAGIDRHALHARIGADAARFFDAALAPASSAAGADATKPL